MQKQTRISIILTKDLSNHFHFQFKPKPFSSSTALPAISSRRISLDHPIPQSLFQSLKRRPSLPELKRVHSRIVTCGVWSHASLATSLINSYLSADDLNAARIIFDAYPSLSPPPTLVWNLLIRAHSKLRDSEKPVSLFARMLGLRVLPDGYTYTFVVTSCSNRRSSDHGEAVHGLALKNGFGSDLFVGNSLVNMYGVLERMGDARKMFDEMPQRDAYSWTGLLRGYTNTSDIGEACEVFDRIPARNEVSWAVMISGLVSHEQNSQALRFFHDMLREQKIEPNEAVLVSALSACSNLGALNEGTYIHSYVKGKYSLTGNIAAALINMYAKCGRVDLAREVFGQTTSRDVSVYTSMISGLSIHGLGEEALRVFALMSEENVKPNGITILGVLNGCSHSGLVDEGSEIFSKMESEWGIAPKIEHYGCHVDMLGRAGFLGKALEVVENMSFDPDLVMWRGLLSNCRIHRDGELGERVAKHVQGKDDVLLSNLNASLGKWERVAELRKNDRERRNKGRSLIEIEGIVHEFQVDDQVHPMIEEIRENLAGPASVGSTSRARGKSCLKNRFWAREDRGGVHDPGHE